MEKRRKTRPADLLGPLEAQIMSTVWRNPGVSGAEATELINDKRDVPLSPRTVLTVLSRLEAKGYLAHVVEGRTYLYTAVVREEDFVAWHAERAIRALRQRYGCRHDHFRTGGRRSRRPRRARAPRRSPRSAPRQ